MTFYKTPFPYKLTLNRFKGLKLDVYGWPIFNPLQKGKQKLNAQKILTKVNHM